MKRIGKWILIAFALILGALAVLFFIKPETFLVAAIIVTMLFNPGPPPIAEGQITSSDWLHWDEGGRKLTAVLERRFPNGTPESDLNAVLLKQGFHSIPPPPADCLPPGRSAPVGVVYRTCLTADEKEKLERTLEYRWGDGVCAEYVQIWWSVDDRREITHVQGSYYGACL
jgi:hypothetical protein